MSAQRRLLDVLYEAMRFDLMFAGTSEDPCGIGPRRGGQFQQYGRYCAAGWLEYVGDGFDIDGGCDREWPVYRLTPKGARLVLEDAEAKLAHHAKVDGHPEGCFCGLDRQVDDARRAIARAEARAAAGAS